MRQPKEILINGVNLDVILVEHKLWLNNEGGKRANLRGANLRDTDLQRANLQGANLEGANLQYANLRDANLQYANLRDTDLQRANLQGANLEGANLQGANLQYANLRDANLRGANLDFSCMPLWCGDLKTNYDDKQIIQQLYHVLSHIKYSENASDELKELLSETNLKFANRFHRVDECGELEV